MTTATDAPPAGLFAAALGRHQAGDLARAEDLYRRILRADPGHAEAVHGLGVIAYQHGRLDEAADHVRHALRLDPDFAEARSNLAAILTAIGRARCGRDRCEDALPAFREAARLAPDAAGVHHDLGTALRLLLSLDEAVASFDDALRLAPDAPLTHVNRATARLLAGDFAGGWAEYEWRWHAPDLSPRRFPRPLWDGGPLAGKTVLLHAEQGLGDTLQFVRYAPLVRRRGGRVVVSAPAALLPLLAGCPGVDELVDQDGVLPPFDVHAPLLSLPAILKTTAETIPADVPYLFPDPDRVEPWRRRLADVPGLKVGVCWQGNPEHPEDRRRSFPLAALEPLARVPGVRLVGLQRGHGAEQVAELAGRFPVVSLGDDVDRAGAFRDTAAVMASLDLVVTVDSATAHLAGGLGVPVWVALSRVPDWRWLLGRGDSPWYPTMRLFRQETAGDWGPVFAAMARELETLAAKPAGRGQVPIEVAPGELFDRVTILEIKSERMTTPGQLAHVRAELAALTAARERCLPGWRREEALVAALRAENAVLWDVEDAIRACERAADFGARFVELARAVYTHNDRRSALKRQLSERFGGRVYEQKSYAPAG